jgi:hypothetical protein
MNPSRPYAYGSTCVRMHSSAAFATTEFAPGHGRMSPRPWEVTCVVPLAPGKDRMCQALPSGAAAISTESG